MSNGKFTLASGERGKDSSLSRTLQARPTHVTLAESNFAMKTATQILRLAVAPRPCLLLLH